MLRTPRARSATVFSLLLLAVFGLTGCSDSDELHDLVLILTPTSNAPAVQVADLDPLLQAVDQTDDRVVVVVADGTPGIVLDFTVGELSGRSNDRDDELADLRGSILSAATEATAATDEIDLSEAIALGAEAFRPGKRHEMVVFGSGLQTTGALNLTEGRLYAEPSDLVTHAEEQGSLPDLSSVSVKMAKFGVTTAPQPTLNEAARTALTAIWTEYFQRSHALSVDLTATNLVAAASPFDNLRYVTPVPVERPSPDEVVDCRQTLSDGTIGFKPKEAQISEADADAVRAVLERTVSALTMCPGQYVVEGSASSEGDADTNRSLSEARARTVATLLGDVSGVSIDEMHLVGWGESWPCRTPDLADDGTLILDAAVHNRAVSVSKGETGC